MIAGTEISDLFLSNRKTLWNNWLVNQCHVLFTILVNQAYVQELSVISHIQRESFFQNCPVHTEKGQGSGNNRLLNCPESEIERHQCKDQEVDERYQDLSTAKDEFQPKSTEMIAH